MILFDIRESFESYGYGMVEMINKELILDQGSLYRERYGLICSPQWWSCLDRGELPVEILSGDVIHVGPRLDHWGEKEDLVEFSCGNQDIGYDRIGPWLTNPIRVGDRIRILQTTVAFPHWAGSTVWHLEIQAEWISQSSDPRSKTGS